MTWLLVSDEPRRRDDDAGTRGLTIVERADEVDHRRAHLVRDRLHVDVGLLAAARRAAVAPFDGPPVSWVERRLRRREAVRRVLECPVVGADRVAEDRGGDEEARDRERGERGRRDSRWWRATARGGTPGGGVAAIGAVGGGRRRGAEVGGSGRRAAGARRGRRVHRLVRRRRRTGRGGACGCVASSSGFDIVRAPGGGGRGGNPCG